MDALAVSVAMTLGELLAAVGPNWSPSLDIPPGTKTPAKFLDRRSQLAAKLAMARRYLGEYLRGAEAGSVVDFSCGAGALLEVFRAHGHSVLGVEVQYEPLLRAQGIPFVLHNCRNLPYPLPSKSADLVTCIGAITFYGEQPWGPILDEFARIARRTILVIPNTGHVFDAHRPEIEAWSAQGWFRAKVAGGAFKWEVVG